MPAASATEPPAVIVRDLAGIAAVQAIGAPALLMSPPGYALHAGALWWQALLAEAAWSGPALLDCADAAGRAAEALRLGLAVVLDGATPAFPRLAMMAAELGLSLLDKPPPALDLAEHGAPRRLAAWLGQAPDFR
ncbi:MAG: hypothetical protein ACYCZB_10305 [Acidiphilium sp.]